MLKLIVIFSFILISEAAMSNEQPLVNCKSNSCTIRYSGHNDEHVNVPGGTIRTVVQYTGSGDFSIVGNTSSLTINHTGSGELDLSNLDALEVEVVYSGSGALRIKSNGTVTGLNSGSGRISISGSPKVDIEGNGSGKIKLINP